MWFALLLAAVFGIQVAWAVHQIRRELALVGMRVERVRWLPFARLFSSRWTRRHMIYRAWYADRQGVQLTCLAVASVFGGIVFEEQREVRAERSATTRPLRAWSFPWPSVACSLLACFVLGVRYWSAPYRDLDLPSGLLQPELALVVAMAGWLQFVQPTRRLSTLALMALAPVGTVIVRIATDVARDPTSHNLFPFEIVIAAFVGLLAAGLGVGLGALARRLASSAATA